MSEMKNLREFINQIRRNFLSFSAMLEKVNLFSKKNGYFYLESRLSMHLIIHNKKKIIRILFLSLLIIPVIVAFYHHFKSVPDGISYEGHIHETSSFEFLYDLTYKNQDGEVVYEQMIFDTIFELIEEAEDFLVLDLFLFNDDYDHTDPSLDFPNLSDELANRLIEKKEQDPEVDIIFITDPINTFYDTYTPERLQSMEEAGIHVVITDVDPLRDSNPLYSGFYRTYLQWFGSSDAEYLPNAFRQQGPEVNVQSYLSLLNFKANHRKTVMNEQKGVITSANPHDASYYHSNVGYLIQGDILYELLASERAVAEMSGFDTELFDSFVIQVAEDTDEEMYEVQLLTEKQIKTHILDLIEQSRPIHAIKIGMFYLSDREIVEALKDAEDREVPIQIILDINQDAFGNEKNGIPNRPVASELTSGYSSIDIRWYESNGEQFHSKFFLLESIDDVTMIGGSTNFTRRNLDDLNLETNVKVKGTKDQPQVQRMLDYFDRIWENEDGVYTSAYEVHAESSLWKTWLYRFQEWSGLSTF